MNPAPPLRALNGDFAFEFVILDFITSNRHCKHLGSEECYYRKQLSSLYPITVETSQELGHLFPHIDQKGPSTGHGTTSIWKEKEFTLPMGSWRSECGGKRRTVLKSQLYFWQDCQIDPASHTPLLAQMIPHRIDILWLSWVYSPKESRTTEVFGAYKFVFTCPQKHAISTRTLTYICFLYPKIFKMTYCFYMAQNWPIFTLNRAAGCSSVVPSYRNLRCQSTYVAFTGLETKVWG